MLQYIIGAVVTYGVMKVFEDDKPTSSCSASERKAEAYRKSAINAQRQNQKSQKELAWRGVKEEQAKVKKQIASLKRAQQHCSKRSPKYKSLSSKIQQATRKRESLQKKASQKRG